MATRLYTLTKNPRSLEILADVLEGTFDRHVETERLFEEDDLGLYEAFLKDPQLKRMDNFILSGWGRTKPCAEILNPVIGEEKSEVKIEGILKAMGITLSPEKIRLTEGVRWF